MKLFPWVLQLISELVIFDLHTNCNCWKNFPNKNVWTKSEDFKTNENDSFWSGSWCLINEKCWFTWIVHQIKPKHCQRISMASNHQKWQLHWPDFFGIILVETILFPSDVAHIQKQTKTDLWRRLFCRTMKHVKINHVFFPILIDASAENLLLFCLEKNCLLFTYKRDPHVKCGENRRQNSSLIPYDRISIIFEESNTFPIFQFTQNLFLEHQFVFCLQKSRIWTGLRFFLISMGIKCLKSSMNLKKLRSKTTFQVNLTSHD